jgi:hypothetical protein
MIRRNRSHCRHVCGLPAPVPEFTRSEQTFVQPAKNSTITGAMAPASACAVSRINGKPAPQPPRWATNSRP